MNYIILDLEWDGSFYPKINRFINQILQIGAAKLDSDFNIVSTFERTIKSAFSKRVSKRFSELTGITKEIMLSGVSLESAINDYNEWVGDDAVTMTWSNSDIYTVVENQNNLVDVKFKIEKYVDLQKYIQSEMKLRGIELSSQISLLNAANTLNISIDEDSLHNAKFDSVAAASVLKECYNKDRFNSFIVDTSDPEYFKRYTFRPHYICDINDKNIDKNMFVFNCCDCGSTLLEKGKWRVHNCGFITDLFCEKCKKKYSARVRFKQLYDGVKVSRKLFVKGQKNESENNILQ